ncbi:hypothetical protein [Desulfovibrio cuneatus]|uniref:hypothetical protein n=1 Tax=Desulfovibrio cuneatus TaxID=159728 RepID=UPI000415EA6B|nr:hypothetical protein [Desulfovibrio cuneatus]
MAENKKKTSQKIASIAGQVLQDENASAIQRSLAASALAQAASGKQTGADMEAKASAALKSIRSSELTKELAASVLVQSNKER